MDDDVLVFAALGDATRRRILRAVLREPKAVSVLAAEVGVSRSAVSQHLSVLREAGLCREIRDGRRRLQLADPAGLARVGELVAALCAPEPGMPTDTGKPRGHVQQARRMGSGSAPVEDSVDERVRGWARQRQPRTDILAFAMRIDRIAGYINAEASAAAKRVGLLPGELSILSELRHHGAPYEAMPIELKHHFRITLPGMLKRLKRLEANGYVERVRARNGAVGGIVRMTPAGLELLQTTVRAAIVHHQPFPAFYQLEQRDIAELTSKLRLVVLAIERTWAQAEFRGL